jgi:hypothetical protein
VDVNGTVMQRYIDPRYPRMKPIWCTERETEFIRCLVKLGSSFGVPSFSHWHTPCQTCSNTDDTWGDDDYNYYGGYYDYGDHDVSGNVTTAEVVELEHPTEKQLAAYNVFKSRFITNDPHLIRSKDRKTHLTSAEEEDDGSNAYYEDASDDDAPQKTYYCSVIDVLVGVLLFPSGLLEPPFIPEELMNTYTQQDINFITHRAMNMAVYAVGSFEPNENFELCGELVCTMLALNIYDSDNTAVSPHYFEVVDGACRDTINVDTYENLARSPPTLLTEPYYRCSSFLTNNIINAVGISVGNMEIVTNIVLVFAALPLIFLYLTLMGLHLKVEKYTDTDKSAVAHELGLRLLRIADGDLTGVEKGGVLHNLCKEMVGGSDGVDDEEKSGTEGVQKLGGSVVRRKKKPVHSVKKAVQLISISKLFGSGNGKNGGFTSARHDVSTAPAAVMAAQSFSTRGTKSTGWKSATAVMPAATTAPVFGKCKTEDGDGAFNDDNICI